ncbi:MAG: hypothetical protein F4125_02760 [Acidimicrobiaceae bacterium]|nr:hypothetical protein [Acidimicrobiaceae bacterium]
MAAIVLAMLSAVTAAAAASADDINADPGQTNANTGQFEANTGQDEPAAVGFDAEHYALDYGVTGDEARRRLARIPELKSIIQEIVAAEVGRVAGRGIVHEPNFGGWVYLVGDDPPTRATRDLLALHEDVFVDTGATHTLAELQAAVSDRSSFEAVPDSMRDRVAYTEIDVRSNSIVVAIDRDQPPTRTDESIPTAKRPIEALGLPQAAQALEAILEEDTDMPFSVTVDAASEPGAIRGGEHIDTERGTNCTSGFAVLFSEVRGMLTAGHCANITRHWRSRTTASSGDSYLATTHSRSTVWGDDGDWAWYVTAEFEQDDFYVTTTVARDVIDYEVKANMQGDYVCHFGISSGYSCGTVVATDHDPRYDACSNKDCDNIWVKVEGETLESCDGDSGGPWFQDRTAYGIHSGADRSNKSGNCLVPGTGYATFTAIDDILGDMNLELATT